MFDKGKHHKGHGKSLYAERKPEPLDIALHADDIATAGVLSGFKWIEPALPIMYLISGYRAGTGYRNNNKDLIAMPAITQTAPKNKKLVRLT